MANTDENTNPPIKMGLSKKASAPIMDGTIPTHSKF
jgi:hypothetical protein